MNLERLINMVINQVIRRLVNLVVDRGFGLASRQMRSADDPGTAGKGHKDTARQAMTGSDTKLL